MTAQTAAREIVQHLNMSEASFKSLSAWTGAKHEQILAKVIQQAIDEAVKEERERYVKLANSWAKTEGYDSIGWHMCAAELKALIQPISLTGGSP